VVWAVAAVADYCGSVADAPTNGRWPTQRSKGLEESRTGLQSRSSAEREVHGAAQAIKVISPTNPKNMHDNKMDRRRGVLSTGGDGAGRGRATAEGTGRGLARGP